MLLSEEKTSNECLAKELEALEKTLVEMERRQQQLEQENDFSSFTVPSEGKKRPLISRLNTLSIKTDSLVLAQDLASWKNSVQLVKTNKEDDNIQILIMEADACSSLAELILRHPNILELSASLYEDYYLEFFEYCYAALIQTLRQQLFRSNYPKESLVHECHLPLLLQNISQSLSRIESLHNQVLESVEGQSLNQYTPAVIIELFRPIVEKVRFHFVESSEERMFDKLPEWLLTYLREQVLNEGGPYDLVLELQRKGGNSHQQMAFQFLSELVGLAQWVLTKRNFFRSPKIVGTQSNPVLLYTAIEHLIQFDKTVQNCLPTSPSSSEHHFVGLVDLLVVPDEELMTWFIQREKESVFSTLFDTDNTKDIPRPLANLVTPRAEIFCALIRSTQYKASVLTSPARYLREIAVPLCSNFVDALHETVTDLRDRLVSKQSVRQGVTPDLAGNIREWMEVINGARLASNILLREGAWHEGGGRATQSDHDLARFGRSLERLEEVMVEEFSACFVETVLMEKAKCASYLMMASHLLASQEWEGGEGVSMELRETKETLNLFLSVCNSILSVTDDSSNDDYYDSIPEGQIERHAPNALKTHVLNRLADKFLEVALDTNNMTPQICEGGAKIFSQDVQAIFGPTKLPLCLRLLDVAKLLSMDSSFTEGLFLALSGLVGSSSFLDIEDFTTDQRLFEEAGSMIKAKGLSWLELEDAVSLLNRRRD